MTQTITPDRMPEFHFLYIARNVPVAWFFDAARGYFDRFRPTVLPALDLLAYLPAGRTVSVTALVLRDTAALIGVELARVRPDALYDPIVRETFDEVRAVFNARTGLNQPFGVPLADASAAGLSGSIPTPMLPTQPRTFITATPPLAPSPTPAPTDAPATPAPIQPTPGAIIGGS